MGTQTKITRQTKSFWMFWILLLGFILRSIWLDLKPVHFDEGINGHFIGQFWRDGFYRYDPSNFHGPLYFYILALTERLAGWGIAPLRFVTGLISLASVYVVGLHRRFLGATAIFAALILAVSPAFVFYSRYAIHESLFIFGQVAFSYGFLLYRKEKSLDSVWWMALATVVMIATKETFFVFLGTWAIAVACVAVTENYIQKTTEPKSIEPPPDAQHWVAIVLVAGVILIGLFTGFYIYMRGAVDMLTGLQIWTNTGSGAKTGHEKPMMYWVELLTRYEWPCLVGLAASPFIYFSRKANRALKTLVIAGFGSWLAYTLIPYKTPWLIMNFAWLLAFSAGAVIARVMPSIKIWPGLRTGFAVATLGTIVFSFTTMLRLNFRDYTKVGEPYVYVQSTIQFKTVTDALYAHAKKVPQDFNMRIYVMNRDPWPMPYTLIRFPNVTWGHGADTPLDVADVVLSDVEDMASVEKRLKGSYYKLPFQVRDAYQDGFAYLRQTQFQGEFPTTAAVITGGTL